MYKILILIKPQLQMTATAENIYSCWS